MAERDFDQLERDLRALGSTLNWTPTPDLSGAVLHAIAAPTPIRGRRIWKRWGLAAALLLLLAAGVLAASSSARHAVADFLGIDGLRIERGQPDVTAPLAPVLGTPTSRQDLHRWLPFEPMAPSALGPPDAVYLHILENGAPIGMLTWEPSGTLPETAETGLGALLMEFDPPDDIVMLLKTIRVDGSIDETTVAGNSAYWVEGASMLTIFGDAGAATRWSGNVLIWEQNGVGYRFESALSMKDAVAIAETLEPLPAS